MTGLAQANLSIDRIESKVLAPGETKRRIGGRTISAQSIE